MTTTTNQDREGGRASGRTFAAVGIALIAVGLISVSLGGGGTSSVINVRVETGPIWIAPGSVPSIGEFVATTTDDLSSKSDDPTYSARQEFSPHNITVKKTLPPTRMVRSFFSDVMVLIMMSPPRYHLVDLVKDHYAPYFPNMIFLGPHNDTNHSVEIHGYDIVWGNEQYRAVSRVIRKVEASGKYPNLAGYFYLSDDVIIQPWALVSFNKSRIWATQMGVGNARSPRTVSSVPGMSVEGRFRRDWPYWKKNRGKLLSALSAGGPEWRNMLRENMRRTHPFILKWSRYDKAYYTEDAMQWAIFYTIVDTYYVPRRFAIPYADRCDIMEVNWVFGEVAIATMLRSLDYEIDQMHIQFYWSTLNAADCPRSRWGASFSGFHRCRHDHPFAKAVYHEPTLKKMMTDPAFLAKMKAGSEKLVEPTTAPKNPNAEANQQEKPADDVQ